MNKEIVIKLNHGEISKFMKSEDMYNLMQSRADEVKDVVTIAFGRGAYTEKTKAFDGRARVDVGMTDMIGPDFKNHTFQNAIISMVSYSNDN